MDCERRAATPVIQIPQTLCEALQLAGTLQLQIEQDKPKVAHYDKALKRGKAFKQWFIDKGLGEMKKTDMGHSQSLFSLKGEAWVIEKLASEGVA